MLKEKQLLREAKGSWNGDVISVHTWSFFFFNGNPNLKT